MMNKRKGLGPPTYKKEEKALLFHIKSIHEIVVWNLGDFTLFYN